MANDCKDVPDGTAGCFPSIRHLKHKVMECTNKVRVRTINRKAENQVLSTRLLTCDPTYFPPTPNPTQATREAYATKFGAPPAAIPKTPARNNVIYRGVTSKEQWKGK